MGSLGKFEMFYDNYKIRINEELDIDGSETSSQGSIEPDNLEDIDFEEGGMEKHDDQRREPRAELQQGGAEQRPARGDENQNDQEHIINRKGGTCA